MFVKLGDVQVKSTSVAELADQFLSDAVREGRGTDFAFRDAHGGHIRFDAFIDPAEVKLIKQGLINPIGVGHGGFNPARVTAQNRRLKPIFIPHDILLKTSEALAKAFVDEILSLGR
jgi:hypothetical protein